MVPQLALGTGAGMQVTVQFTPLAPGSPVTTAAKLAIADKASELGGAKGAGAKEIDIDCPDVPPPPQLDTPRTAQSPAISHTPDLTFTLFHPVGIMPRRLISSSRSRCLLRRYTTGVRPAARR